MYKIILLVSLLCLYVNSNLVVVHHSLSEVNNNVLLYQLSVETSSASTLYVEYYPPSLQHLTTKNLILRSPSTSNSKFHILNIVRLYEDTEYVYNVYAKNGIHITQILNGEFHTGLLPAILNETTIELTKGHFSTPMVLVSNPSAFGDINRPNLLFAWDNIFQKIVWYFSFNYVRSGIGIGVRSDGDIIINALNCMLRISPLGDIKNNVTTDGCPDFHHEAFVDKDDNTVWTMNIEILDDGYPTIPADIGDTLIKWEINCGTLTQVTKTSNFIPRSFRYPPESNLVPFSYVPCKNESVTLFNTRDWTHGNSLTATDDGKYLIYSARSLSTIFILDKSTYQLKYKVGGADSDFTFGTGANFSVQHSVHLFNNNELLIFDNGLYDSSRVSRALLLSLNFHTRVATKIWEYKLSINETCFTQFMGSAEKYYVNGNVRYLINFPNCDFVNYLTRDTAYIAELDENGSELGLYTYNVIDSWYNYRAREYFTVSGEFYPY